MLHVGPLPVVEHQATVLVFGSLGGARQREVRRREERRDRSIDRRKDGEEEGDSTRVRETEGSKKDMV